jgi:hypothetical protein
MTTARTKLARVESSTPTVFAQTSAGNLVVRFHSAECVTVETITRYHSPVVQELQGLTGGTAGIKLNQIAYRGVLTLKLSEEGFKITPGSVHFDRLEWSGSFARDQLTRAARRRLVAMVETIVADVVARWPGLSREAEITDLQEQLTSRCRDEQKARLEAERLQIECADLADRIRELEEAGR